MDELVSESEDSVASIIIVESKCCSVEASDELEREYITPYGCWDVKLPADVKCSTIFGNTEFLSRDVCADEDEEEDDDEVESESEAAGRCRTVKNFSPGYGSKVIGFMIDIPLYRI